MMNTTDTVHVDLYVERPFGEVCAHLESLKGQPVSDGASAQFAMGQLSFVSRWIARLPIERVGTATEERVVELRVLPVHTGHDALTELLLVADEPSPGARTTRVHEMRSLLEALVRHFDEQVPLEMEGSARLVTH